MSKTTKKAHPKTTTTTTKQEWVAGGFALCAMLGETKLTKKQENILCDLRRCFVAATPLAWRDGDLWAMVANEQKERARDYSL